jgi:hypothetical protein
MKVYLGWEWEHIVPAMSGATFVAKRPGDAAIAIKALEWYAANSLESMRAKVALALIRGRATKTSCEACGRMIFVVEDDRVPATFCKACGGGCVAWPVEEVLP